MCTINDTRGRPFGPDGCQVPCGSGVCGETRTLEIINEFKRLYEEKMNQIDTCGGGDCLQEKIKLQQEWIGDLTEQNQMLVSAVEELEHEATERVHLLEEKLHQSAQCICEVMKTYREHDVTNDLLAEPLQKVFCLENDKKNLLEFIRRIREENRWDVDGLTFFEISYQDLLGSDKSERNFCDMESKNEHLNTTTTKEQNRVKDKECKIVELQGKLDYYKSFGNVQSLADELKSKTEECACLQKSMEETKHALVAEIASKHDIIVQLKTDCQQLEERCIHADKHTAFRDDIIKELRKEIKQLKQQLTQDEIIKLNTTIDELQCNLQRTTELQEVEEQRYRDIIAKLSRTIQGLSLELKDIEEKYAKTAKVCKICKGRAKVQFAENAEVQACLDEGLSDCQMDAIQSKDEIIKVQCNTLNILQLELQSLKKLDYDLRLDQENKYREIHELKNRVVELENALCDCEAKAENLQLAVDLYLNSINVLEATEEKYKIEIDQQKSTIFNLQSALVATKQELDEIRQKSEENEQEQHSLINSLNIIMFEVDQDNENLTKQCESITDQYEHLQDLNFDLEVEHCNSLQDVDLLENQLFKYQTLLKSSEEENMRLRCHLKKYIKQKKCYEEVIAYFKKEMGSMSEQLIHLQELMTLSNESTQEETCKLMQALVNVQALNEKLSTQLIAAEQKVALENQMNQLQEAKIGELQELISDREIDLSRHDQAIRNIRQSLQCSMTQNEELRATIIALNDTIAQLHGAVNLYEVENSKCKENAQECRSQISVCMSKLEELKCNLDKKTADLQKLEMAYNHQNRFLKAAQLELKEIKERQKEKQCHIKCTIEELTSKLVKSEEAYSNLCQEFSKVQSQLAALVKKEAVKDQEVKRYRKIVCELKQTLIELNKSLTNRDVQKAICKNEECRRNMEHSEDARNEEACLNCPCEVEFYQNIVDTLKKSVIDLKKRLTDTQKKNQQLEADGKRKEAMLAELSKSHSQRDKEYNDLRQKLKEKLKQTQAEEARYQELAKQFQCELECIREELEVKTMELDDVKKGALEINSSRCVQLACAQEEVNALKEDLNQILRKHCALNAENEKLHCQSACMQATVNELEEKSQLLKGQLEQYLSELQCVQNEKDVLAQKNSELLLELRSIQYACTGGSNRQNRYTNESVKLLESELSDLRNSRDDVCSESKNVINYVRAWLQEQKKLNEQTARRERIYCNTIRRLKEEYEAVQCQYAIKPQKVTRFVTPIVQDGSPQPQPPTCESPWSLGSQGTASCHDIDSHSRSPSPQQQQQQCDWYCTNFRNDSEEDEDEDWVSKVENLAAQVRKTNKMWKNKMGHHSDFTVSKDTKK